MSEKSKKGVSLSVPKSKQEASQNWKLLMAQTGAGTGRPYRRRVRKTVAKGPDKVDTAAAQTPGHDPVTKTDTAPAPHPAMSQAERIPGFPVYDSTGKQVGGKVLSPSEKKLTWCVAMDCEMVGVGPMKESALARVSIVNEAGHCVLDKFVKPKVKVTDYRTAVSGIRQSDLDHAPTFDSVVWEVSTILKGRVVVGHALEHDFRALLLNHPKLKMRDTSMFYKTSRKPALKALARKFLNISIQEGEHNSILDAQAAMKLYLINRKNWEEQIKTFKNARRRGAASMLVTASTAT